MILPLLIFAATYAAVAAGRLPFLRVDRAGAALIGASLMVGFGILTLEEAYRAIDLNTLVLLFGMMIVVANLRLAGFFGLAASFVARRARHPLGLLAGIIAVSGALSAFLVNDTVCLMLTPLVAELAARLNRNPLPYLLGLAMASNIGSTATITGNPQNIMIGSFSHISYARFAAALSPVAAIGVLILFAVLALGFRREFLTRDQFRAVSPRVRIHRVLLIKSVSATALIIAAFFGGVDPAKAAILGGSLLLITRRIKPERVYAEIDWALLLLFAGLFIVIAGVEKTLLAPEIAARAATGLLDQPAILAAVATLLSNIVSNVPAVLALKPFVAALPHADRAWLTLAMASTLAGNLTIVGSIANLIVVQRAHRLHVEIGFSTYLKVGIPVTLLTILAGIWWLGRG